MVETKTPSNEKNVDNGKRILEIPLNERSFKKFDSKSSNPKKQKIVSGLVEKFQFNTELVSIYGEPLVLENEPVSEEAILKIINSSRQSGGELLEKTINGSIDQKTTNILQLRLKPGLNFTLEERECFDKYKKLLNIAPEDFPKIQEEAKLNVETVLTIIEENHPEGALSKHIREVLDKIMRDFLENDSNIAIAVSFNALFEIDEGHTLSHCLKVFDYGYSLVEAIANSPEEFEEKDRINKSDLLLFGKILLAHDVGKAVIDSLILTKPGKLTEEEYSLVKLHAYFTFMILSNNEKIVDEFSLGAALHHLKEIFHDKSYSPATTHRYLLKPETLQKIDKLMQKPIMKIIQRILYLPDVFDALINKRSYNEQFTKESALKVLYKENSKGFSYEPYFNKFVEVILQKEAYTRFNNAIKEQIDLFKKEGVINSKDANTRKGILELTKSVNEKYKAVLKQREPSLDLIDKFAENVVPAMFVKKFGKKLANVA